MSKKLNLGCGNDYREGWINIDINPEVKTDLIVDLEKPLPFPNNYFSYILADNTLEHIKNIFQLIDELWRVSKPNAIIEIYVPHFTGIYATKHLAHYHQFGIDSFNIYQVNDVFNKERYGNARFEIEQKLIYFHHNYAVLCFLSKLPINWLFNFSRYWQIFCEKFLPLKFDEVYFKLKVIKKNE
ncbi:MAG: class I SAM-dependent methyltransferase [Candidatus Helarchaeota archaeon]